MSSSEPVHLAFKLHEPHDDAEGKAPVIFIHGVTASKENWGDIPKIVADEYQRKVYALDLRHHGDSPWSDAFEFDSNRLDLHHFMDAHKIDKAILVGHSMGGVISMMYALEMPQKVEKLLIEEAAIGEIPAGVITFLKYKLETAKDCIEELPDNLTAEEAHSLLPKLMMEKFPEEMRGLVKFDETTFVMKKVDGKFTAKANLAAILSALDNFSNTIPQFQGRYCGPACFIYGKKSPFDVDSVVDTIKTHFPNAKMVEVQDAGHTVHKECHSEFMNILLKFLREDCVSRL